MQRPVLALDARANATGIGRYTDQLLGGLRKALKNVELWCIAHPSSHAKLAGQVDRVIESSAPMYSLEAQMKVPGLVHGASLLHCTHYDIPALYDRPLSVTIHDVTHLIDPSFRDSFKGRVLAKSLMKLAVTKARRIITVSQYSKRMIVEHLGGSEDRISVIHLQASSVFTPMEGQEAARAVQQELGITRPFFLFVGNLKPHKNLPVLLQALALLLSRRRDAPSLVVVGKDAKNERRLRSFATQLTIQDRVHWVSGISDELLRACYSAAQATVVPSRQEGFGLPVVESMACGTPVICADAASLPEIAGGCALLFDPSSPEECCERLTQILESNLRGQLSSKGIKRASQFASDRIVQQHAKVFGDLLA